MNEIDEMIPDEVDVSQWLPKPRGNPFPDSVYGHQAGLSQANWVAQELNSISPETSPPLQDNFHPFKIVIADSLIYVFPGYVYGNTGSKQFKRVIPTIGGSPLGNPLYGEGFPSLALSEQYLWIKVTIANSSIYTAEIVYSSEASALDSDTVRYIQIGKTYTNGTIEQRLKENAFVNIKAADWAEVTFNSITAATTGTVNISAGCVMRTETGTPSGTSPAPTKILTRLKDGAGDFLPKLETAVSVTNGDKVYMVLTYTQSTYGTDDTVFYDCTDAEYVVSTSASDSDTASYIHIADIIIADSVMTIKPKFPGVVTAPTLVLPKDAVADPDLDDDSELLFNTIAAGGLDVELKAGQLAVSAYSNIGIDGTWATMRVVKTIAVSSETLTLDDDSDQYIYLKVEFQLNSPYTAYRAQFQDVSLVTNRPNTYDTEAFVGDTGAASAGTAHTHPMDHTHSITLKAGGFNELSAELLVSFKEYYTHDIVVSDTVLTDTDDLCYFKIAKAVTAGGALTSLKRYIKGCPITIPLVSVTYGTGIGD